MLQKKLLYEKNNLLLNAWDEEIILVDSKSVSLIIEFIKIG